MKAEKYHVTIIEKDGTIKELSFRTRKVALEVTNAAENVRNCKCWKITYINPIY